MDLHIGGLKYFLGVRGSRGIGGAFGIGVGRLSRGGIDIRAEGGGGADDAGVGGDGAITVGGRVGLGVCFGEIGPLSAAAAAGSGGGCRL